MNGKSRLIRSWNRTDKSKWIAYFVIFVYLTFVLLPFFFTFITSIKTNKELTTTPISYLVKNPTWKPYYSVLFERAYGRYMLNTLIVSLSVVVLCTLFGVPAAYALAKYRLPFKSGMLLSTISVRLIPPISLIVPFFLFIRIINALDTLQALIMVNFLMNLPFFIWIAWGFLKDLPAELEEAAMIDGCTRLQALWKVTIPIASPGLGAAAIVSFLFTWNEYLFALTFTQSVASKTISVGISDFVGDVFVRWNMISAAGILTTIPALIFVFVFQSYIVEGLTAGSVKG